MADASGTDGEGLQIGDGDVNFAEIMPAVIASGATLVPEIWLGHRNGGEGFIMALHRLSRIMGESRPTL
jgi:N-acetylneuraminate synthase